MRTTTKRAGEAKKLRKLPSVSVGRKRAVVDAPKRTGSPKKVVQNLQDELARLLARGYSVEEVGNVLRRAGFDVSATTLRGYARSATKRAGDAPSAPVEKRKVAARKATTAKRRAPAAKSAAAPAPAAREFLPAKATFVVRPDTPDSDL